MKNTWKWRWKSSLARYLCSFCLSRGGKGEENTLRERSQKIKRVPDLQEVKKKQVTKYMHKYAEQHYLDVCTSRAFPLYSDFFKSPWRREGLSQLLDLLSLRKWCLQVANCEFNTSKWVFPVGSPAWRINISQKRSDIDPWLQPRGEDKQTAHCNCKLAEQRRNSKTHSHLLRCLWRKLSEKKRRTDIGSSFFFFESFTPQCFSSSKCWEEKLTNFGF